MRCLQLDHGRVVETRGLERLRHVLRLVLRDLPPGRYAVNAFHDENGNGDLDTNFIGVPSEGYGFANDPDTSFGPADFDAAAVDVGDTDVVAAMNLRYR